MAPVWPTTVHYTDVLLARISQFNRKHMASSYVDDHNARDILSHVPRLGLDLGLGHEKLDQTLLAQKGMHLRLSKVFTAVRSPLPLRSPFSAA
jgi:hypothetical protein